MAAAAALAGLLFLQAARAEAGEARVERISDPAGHPGMLGWRVQDPGTEAGFSIELSYKFWDPKIDGDVPSKRPLNLLRCPAKWARASFTVFLDARQSLLEVAGSKLKAAGSGYPIDRSFAPVEKPGRNADGAYVLCLKAADPGHPPEPGNTLEAAGWIELVIDESP